VLPDNKEVIKKASEEPEPGGRNETSKVSLGKNQGHHVRGNFEGCIKGRKGSEGGNGRS